MSPCHLHLIDSHGHVSTAKQERTAVELPHSTVRIPTIPDLFRHATWADRQVVRPIKAIRTAEYLTRRFDHTIALKQHFENLKNPGWQTKFRRAHTTDHDQKEATTAFGAPYRRTKRFAPFCHRSTRADHEVGL